LGDTVIIIMCTFI